MRRSPNWRGWRGKVGPVHVARSSRAAFRLLPPGATSTGLPPPKSSHFSEPGTWALRQSTNKQPRRAVCARKPEKTYVGAEQIGGVVARSHRESNGLSASPRSNQIDATLFDLMSVTPL